MSPDPEERLPKRQKSDSTAMAQNAVEIDPDGDTLLAVSAVAGTKDVALRASAHVLTIASTVFKRLLAENKTSTNGQQVLSLPEDDGDIMLLLVNIMHLRNDQLPSRLSLDALMSLGKMAEKYQCVTAVSRATVSWFDRLYVSAKANASLPDYWKLVQTAYMLDEPIFFTRFSECLVLKEPFVGSQLLELANSDSGSVRAIATTIHNRQVSQTAAVRADLDLLSDPCSAAFSKTAKHYIDYAPGMTPDEDDEGRTAGSICHVDEQAATAYLGALRDDGIWPPTVWQDSLGAVIEKLQAFRVPDYDDADKCDFCEDVKSRFTIAVGIVKKMHKERLWGLCLDCFKAGGLNASECRNEHSKPKA